MFLPRTDDKDEPKRAKWQAASLLPTFWCKDTEGLGRFKSWKVLFTSLRGKLTAR